MASTIGLYYSHFKEVTHSKNSNVWHNQFIKALQFRLKQLYPALNLKTFNVQTDSIGLEEDVVIFIYSPHLFEHSAIQKHLQSSNTNCFFVFNHPFNKGDLQEVSITKTYSFFYLDNETELIMPLSLSEELHIQQLFWSNINDLARDVLSFFKKNKTSSNLPKIYLATTSEDIVEFRAMIKRELEEYGFDVVPKENFPFETLKTMSSINEMLKDCQLSIHLIGSLFEEKLDDDSLSLSFLQNTLASQQSSKTNMKRLIWFPPKMLIEDERQEEVVKYIRQNPRAQQGAEIFEAPIEELKFAVHEQMNVLNHSTQQAHQSNNEQDVDTMYIICNEADVEEIQQHKHLFEKDKYSIQTPDFSLKGTSFRTHHLNLLKNCDSAIVYYSSGSKNWLAAKMNDFLKISGYGRQKPWKMQGLYHKKPLHQDYQAYFSKLKVVQL